MHGPGSCEEVVLEKMKKTDREFWFSEGLLSTKKIKFLSVLKWNTRSGISIDSGLTGYGLLSGIPPGCVIISWSRSGGVLAQPPDMNSKHNDTWVGVSARPDLSVWGFKVRALTHGYKVEYF